MKYSKKIVKLNAIIDTSLDKYSGTIIFPEKLEAVNSFLKNVKLPTISKK